MPRFSERMGFQPIATDLKDDEMPPSLRNGLWDALSSTLFPPYNPDKGDPQFRRDVRLVLHLSKQLWFSFFREPKDTIPEGMAGINAHIRKVFFSLPPYGLYDFLDFLSQAPQDEYVLTPSLKRNFVDRCNLVLEREKSSFRFIDDLLVRISNQEGIDEIERAMTQTSAQGVQVHIRRAAELYSERPNADYRNSVKESISAVESAVSFITGEKTYGVSRPLKKVFEQYPVHPALREGFEKLYAYTSDANGIRHALQEESDLTQEDARYMLVSCSAFANYLLATHARRSGGQEDDA